MKVLIVEDDPMMRLGLKHSLHGKDDLEVVGVAEDGYVGVETAKLLLPDIVVMDVGMPHMDGITATQEIKAALPETHVVMLTSHTSETEIVAALSSGADAYCIKGKSVDSLLRAIAVAREGAKYIDAQVAQRIFEQLKPPTQPVNGAIGQLSDREMEVLKLIVDGYSNPEIASMLYISTNTVKTYVKGIMNKLVVNDRVQAAVVALRSGLVQF